MVVLVPLAPLALLARAERWARVVPQVLLLVATVALVQQHQ